MGRFIEFSEMVATDPSDKFLAGCEFHVRCDDVALKTQLTNKWLNKPLEKGLVIPFLKKYNDLKKTHIRVLDISKVLVDGSECALSTRGNELAAEGVVEIEVLLHDGVALQVSKPGFHLFTRASITAPPSPEWTWTIRIGEYLLSTKLKRAHVSKSLAKGVIEPALKAYKGLSGKTASLKDVEHIQIDGEIAHPSRLIGDFNRAGCENAVGVEIILMQEPQHARLSAGDSPEEEASEPAFKDSAISKLRRVSSKLSSSPLTSGTEFHCFLDGASSGMVFKTVISDRWLRGKTFEKAVVHPFVIAFNQNTPPALNITPAHTLVAVKVNGAIIDSSAKSGAISYKSDSVVTVQLTYGNGPHSLQEQQAIYDDATLTSGYIDNYTAHDQDEAFELHFDTLRI